MYILSLHYIKPLSDIEQHLPAHIAYLDRYYAAGKFLMSGRKEPRTGGIILLCAADDAEVQAIIAEDPFHQAGVSCRAKPPPLSKPTAKPFESRQAG